MSSMGKERAVESQGIFFTAFSSFGPGWRRNPAGWDTSELHSVVGDKPGVISSLVQLSLLVVFEVVSPWSPG